MKETNNKKIQALDQLITQRKTQLLISQTNLITNHKDISTPKKEHGDNLELKNEDNQYKIMLNTYMTSNNKLKDSLEEKTKVLELQKQKDNLRNQAKIQKLILSCQQLKQNVQYKDGVIQKLKTNISQLRQQLNEKNKIINEKLTYIKKIDTQNAYYRQQNIKLVLQNKSFKADNKILIKYIDKMKQEKGNHNIQIKLQQQKIIKKLYQKSFPSADLLSLQKEEDIKNQLTNKILLEKHIQANQNINKQLKSHINRLKEQLTITKEQLNIRNAEIKILKEQIAINTQIINMNKQMEKTTKSLFNATQEKQKELENQNHKLKELLQDYESQNTEFLRKYLNTRPRPGYLYNYHS